MAGDTKVANYDIGHKIDDPTRENLLADVRDQMLSVPVRLPNGTIENRQYEVHLPNGMTSIPADKHLPVVYALDGTTANKPYTAGKTVRDWNAPGVGSLPTDSSYNDVDYFKSVMADVNARFHPQTADAAAFSLGGEYLAKLNSSLPVGTFSNEYIVNSTVFGTEGTQANAAGGAHATVATDSNGVNPPASAFDATSDMARWFGLRKD
ncbi:unnamed protein product [Sphagnum balticum]